MLNRAFVLTCVMAAGLLTAASTQAAWAPLTTVNYLTFTRTVALPGALLAPGTYAFEAGPSHINSDVVRVTTRDGQRVLFMGFTVRTHRPGGIGATQPVRFDEAPAGEPLPIAVWNPIGSASGHEFIYR